jgi:hypothetical protein
MFRAVALAMISIVMLVGCSKAAPDCNDLKTKQKVLEKVGVIPVVIPAFLATKQRDPNITVDDFLKNNIKIAYSDNGVTITMVSSKGPVDVASNMKDIRTINFNKDIGKYECACNVTQKMGNAEGPQPMPVNYTSELADGSKHYVSVTVLDPLDPTNKRTVPDMDLKSLVEKMKAEGIK